MRSPRPQKGPLLKSKGSTKTGWKGASTPSFISRVCAKSVGVRPLRLVCGRLVRPVGAVVDPSSMIWRASLRLANKCSLRHSSRSLPLKLSTNPFCIGLPGVMPCSSCQYGVRGELGAIVADDHAWTSDLDVKFTHNTQSGERGVNDQAQAPAVDSVSITKSSDQRRFRAIAESW
jgi:hypothetical protein